MTRSSALVLLSGGQDSAVCLAWALERFDRVETIGFEYGQRHRVELDVRADFLAAITRLSADWSTRLGEDQIVDLSVLGEVSDTALTRDREIELSEAGLPSTFVPARNLVFLTFAA
ncbi:MAG: 7-cyano-7-deazaguanine synthase, partial [Pseudomonadota bacterium]